MAQHRIHLAEMLVRVGSVPGAIEVYRGALQLYLDSNDLKKALALCQVILRLSPGDLAVRQLKGELTEKLNPTRVLPLAPLPPPPVAPRPQQAEELTTEESWLAFQFAQEATASSAQSASYWHDADNHAWSGPGDRTRKLDPLAFVEEGPTEPHKF